MRHDHPGSNGELLLVKQLDDTDALVLASDMWAEACGRVQAGALGDPTPCANWSVTDLLDHVTGGNHFTVAILSGASKDQALQAARDSFAGQEDPVEHSLASTAEQLVAFTQPGALDRPCQHVVGELSGRAVLRLRVHDVMIHTWDLNQAVATPAPGLDARLARWAMAEMAEPDSLTARHIAIRSTEPPTTPHRLLAAFGRRRDGWARPPA